MTSQRKKVNEIKVRFQLEILEDGFPPIGVETLNALLIDDDTVKLDNTPFFAESVAAGDVLKVSKTNSEHIVQFESVLSHGGNKSIAIIFIDDACKEDIYQYFKTNSCYCEYGEFRDFNMLAVSIGSEMDYGKIASYLDEKERLGELSYAELCI